MRIPGDTVTTIIITPFPMFTPTSIFAHITVTTDRTIIPTGTIDLTGTGTDTRRFSRMKRLLAGLLLAAIMVPLAGCIVYERRYDDGYRRPYNYRSYPYRYYGDRP